LNSSTLQIYFETISFEEKSNCDKELSESRERYVATAMNIGEQIRKRFPFIDVIIREVDPQLINDFYPYGLFEIQIAAHDASKTGILYSKRISKILPDYHKIIEEICTKNQFV
jgi:heat shock protein HspQ